jgi:hypothetical protein
LAFQCKAEEQGRSSQLVAMAGGGRQLGHEEVVRDPFEVGKGSGGSPGAVHSGGSGRWGNGSEEVRHKVVGDVRVVEEVHDTGWDHMRVAVELEVGWRERSAWRRMRVKGNQCWWIGLVVTTVDQWVRDV